MQNQQNEDLQPSSAKKQGKLYIVSTPIGNNDDITLRAIKALKGCDLVVCEEIKCGSQLLHKLNINKKLDSLNEQNELEKTTEIFNMIQSGAEIALISDHGTPLLADPGLHLVKSAISHNIEIEVVPGVSSIMTALVRSGFPLDSFLFAGFLSRERNERKMQLKNLSKEAKTVALLETPYRLLPLLEACAETMPGRQAYLGANLTMHYETHHYGTFKELFEKFQDQKFKGEFVVCFEGITYSYALDNKDSYQSDTFEESGSRRNNFSREMRRGSSDRDRKSGGFGNKRSGGGFKKEGFGRDRGFDRDKREGGFRRENDDNNYTRDRGFDRDKREGGFRRDNDDNNYTRDRGFDRDKREGGFRRDNDDNNYTRDRGFDRDKREGGFRKDFGSNYSRDDRKGGNFGRSRKEGGFGKDFGSSSSRSFDRDRGDGGFRKERADGEFNKERSGGRRFDSDKKEGGFKSLRGKFTGSKRSSDTSKDRKKSKSGFGSKKRF